MANPASDTTDEDTPVIVNLLDNDTHPDGDTLTVTAASVDPAEGSVSDNGDGTWTFTPAPDFNGTATVTYTIVDENGDESTSTTIV